MADPIAADAVWDTASYRIAEMYWLLEAKRLNELALIQPESEEFKRSAARYQAANEALYGKPDKEITANVYGEIFAQIDAKALHPTAQVLYDELLDGTIVYIGSEPVHVPGARGKSNGRLPADIKEKVRVFGEVIEEDFADSRLLLEEYWNEVVISRAEELGEKPGYTIHDMEILFSAVHQLRDPENKAHISVVIHPDSSQLAWDTPSMSVRIGENRAPITSIDDMFAKVIHESEIHAGKARAGLQTELPILGTGVYTDANDGERADYLTHEEGIASLAEIAVDSSFSKWKPLHISRYLAGATAYQGMDFRQSFEVNWRARVLMTVKSGEPLNDSIINKEKRQAYISVTRIYRGTPTHLAGGPVLTFNKDLAYLPGKLEALNFLDRVGDDKDEIRRSLRAKIDPNNPRQYELMRRYEKV